MPVGTILWLIGIQEKARVIQLLLLFVRLDVGIRKISFVGDEQLSLSVKNKCNSS